MMIKNVYLIIFFLSVPLFAKTDKKCPPGQYLIQGHYRSAYTTADGKNVSATNVKPYCKLLTRAYGYVVNRYKDGTPPKWPHKSEKSKLWTDLEKQKIIELLEQIPEALLSERIVGFYRLQKSKDYHKHNVFHLYHNIT